ncbi:hypothetical protein ACNJYA_09740 [Bradyrhizobium sp. DASA03068]|uniref:hypothetical protein n=1 Tax=Bradyrhizobium sp. BLXBL-01 TaxID=3395915 RepID=UPI003F6FAE6F
MTAIADYHVPAEKIIEARAVLIADELDRRGIKLRRVGRRTLEGPCPVCGGTNRFGVDTVDNVWTCRRCPPSTVCPTIY